MSPHTGGRKHLTDTPGFSIQSLRVQNKVFHLIDTPEFNQPDGNDCEILNELAYLLTVANEQSIRLSGVIYLHPITDTRVQGTALRSLNVLKTMCGPENYSGLIMATTRWDEIMKMQETNARSRQLELGDKDRFWGDIKRGGGHVTTLSTSRNDALSLLEHISNNKFKFPLAFERQLIIEKRPISETDTGRLLYKAALDQYNESMEKLEDLRAELRQEACARQSDHDGFKEYRQEIARSIKGQEEVMQKLRTTSQALLQSRRAQLSRPSTIPSVIFSDMATTKLSYQPVPSTILQTHFSSGDNTEPSLRPSDMADMADISIGTIAPSQSGIVIARKTERGHRALGIAATVLGTGQLVAALACIVM